MSQVIEFAPRYLSIKMTVARYSTSKSTIYRLLRTGDLGAKKRGGRTLIDRELADRYFASLPWVELSMPKD
jgi:excisionase family DNA binding protein